jgi:hypothetical protein
MSAKRRKEIAKKAAKSRRQAKFLDIQFLLYTENFTDVLFVLNLVL